MVDRQQIVAQLIEVAQEHNKPLAPLHDDLPLLHSGLDSLCLAVIVARLEDLLGIDPFSANEGAAFPVTIGDFVKFYQTATESCGMESSAPDVLNERLGF